MKEKLQHATSFFNTFTMHFTKLFKDIYEISTKIFYVFQIVSIYLGFSPSIRVSTLNNSSDYIIQLLYFLKICKLTLKEGSISKIIECIIQLTQI